MVKYMLGAIELRKFTFKLYSFLPHFFYVRMAEEHRKGDWQLKLFGMVNALMLDPRGLVQMETVAALHTFYQKKVNMMDRVPTSTKPSGHNLPLGLQSTWEEFGPMWDVSPSLSTPCPSSRARSRCYSQTGKGLADAI